MPGDENTIPIEEALPEAREVEEQLQKGFNLSDLPKEGFGKITDNWRFLRDTYGLRNIRVAPVSEADHPSVAGGELDFEEAIVAFGVLRAELSKYPPDFIKSLDISTVRILRNLNLKGEDDMRLEEVAGVALETGVLYIALMPERNPEFYARTIHHELAHIADYEEYELKDKFALGELLDAVNDSLLDLRWRACSPGNMFRYKGKRWRESEEAGEFGPEGFATPYGTVNPKEDRATVIEYLMTRTGALLDRCSTDKILADKVKFVLKLFERRTNGAMGIEYFARLAEEGPDGIVWN